VNDGIWRGAEASQTIAFGVSRPVRPMALHKPIDLDGFSTDRFLVRTRDNRGAYSLPPDAVDPDEILVTADSRSRQPERLQLILGREQFSSCSSLTFERALRRLTLRCAAPSPAAAGAAAGGHEL
jgi:hypothetical protein